MTRAPAYGQHFGALGQIRLAGRNPGLIEAGNIDLLHRPHVRTPAGKIATIRSISVATNKGVFLIPTVVRGRILSNSEAIRYWHKTQQHLGRFRRESQAIAYARRLHKQQAGRIQ